MPAVDSITLMETLISLRVFSFLLGWRGVE
jgi:hypothetical protein